MERLLCSFLMHVTGRLVAFPNQVKLGAKEGMGIHLELREGWFKGPREEADQYPFDHDRDAAGYRLTQDDLVVDSRA